MCCSTRPANARRILDLGTGDGRLVGLLRIDRPEMLGVGLDVSELCSPRRAGASPTKRASSSSITISRAAARARPLDAVVSSFAIHHLEHERKRSLYGEIFELLEPRGVFANLEHVASPTNRLHLAFFL